MPYSDLPILKTTRLKINTAISGFIIRNNLITIAIDTLARYRPTAVQLRIFQVQGSNPIACEK